MKTLKSILLSLMAITMVTVFFSSCEKDSETVAKNDIKNANDNQRIINALCDNYDNCEDDIEITEHGIILQKCMHVDKENFLKYLDNPPEIEPVIIKVSHPTNPNEMMEIELNSTELEERQNLRSSTRFAKQGDVGNIRIYIRPAASNSACNGGYTATVIDNAIAEINNIVGSKVWFGRTNTESEADIIIGCDTEVDFWDSVNRSSFADLDDDIGGIANYPSSSSNRTIGKYVSFNNQLFGTTYPSYRGRIIKHELLHTIGVAHTDDDSRFHLFGTPTIDNSSIMNGGPTVSTLSPNDKKLLRLVWPDYLVAPQITNTYIDAADNLVINYKNPDWINRPYQRVSFNVAWAGSVSKIGSGVSLGGGRYYWKIPIANFSTSGNRWLNMIGSSHRGEVNTVGSNWVSVTFPDPES